MDIHRQIAPPATAVRWRTAFLHLVQAELVLNALLEDADPPEKLIDLALLDVWRAEQELEEIDDADELPAQAASEVDDFYGMATHAQ